MITLHLARLVMITFVLKLNADKLRWPKTEETHFQLIHDFCLWIECGIQTKRMYEWSRRKIWLNSIDLCTFKTIQTKSCTRIEWRIWFASSIFRCFELFVSDSMVLLPHRKSHFKSINFYVKMKPNGNGTANELSLKTSRNYHLYSCCTFQKPNISWYVHSKFVWLQSFPFPIIHLYK